MIKVFATNVVVSKGYNNSPALKFSDNGEHVRFRIGQKVYDSREDDNSRWNNYTVKAFGPLCERIQKMQVKEGSFINLVGDLDEDVWTDEETGEIKRMTVIILKDIEYASGGGKSSRTQEAAQQQTRTASKASKQPNKKTSANPEASENFSGYEPFGGEDFFGQTV